MSNAKNDQTTAQNSQKSLKITQKIQLFAQKHTEIYDLFTEKDCFSTKIPYLRMFLAIKPLSCIQKTHLLCPIIEGRCFITCNYPSFFLCNFLRFSKNLHTSK